MFHAHTAELTNALISNSLNAGHSVKAIALKSEYAEKHEEVSTCDQLITRGHML
jgi:hypothetical protein